MNYVFLVAGLIVGAGAMWWVTRRHATPAESMPSLATTIAPTASASSPESSEELGRLRVALDSLPIGVVYADPSGRIALRNRIAEHAAGARHGDILVDEAVEAHLRAASTGEERRQVLDLYGPPARVLSLHAQPVEAGGAIATIEDVTERSRLDAVRTDFVANISHELKTPVGAISILAETLADSDDPEVVGRLSSKIVREADRLAHTIDDLLELSRIELGGDAVRELVSVGLVLSEAVDRVRPLSERRKIRVVVIEPPGRLTALGDRRQLVSALGNLIDNAVKYSEAESEVEVSAVSDGQMVTFKVTDHGMGIPTQHLDRIFERFYRVDRARSRETGGTGLGLAIVRHVAANHGGEVKVTSQEGEGSTFLLRIPSSAGLVPVRTPEANTEYPVAG